MHTHCTFHGIFLTTGVCTSMNPCALVEAVVLVVWLLPDCHCCKVVQGITYASVVALIAWEASQEQQGRRCAGEEDG